MRFALVRIAESAANNNDFGTVHRITEELPGGRKSGDNLVKDVTFGSAFTMMNS